MEQAIKEAYKRFPDEVEQVDYHLAGKIVVDRGGFRYAFISGVEWARKNSEKSDV